MSIIVRCRAGARRVQCIEHADEVSAQPIGTWLCVVKSMLEDRGTLRNRIFESIPVEWGELPLERWSQDKQTSLLWFHNSTGLRGVKKNPPKVPRSRAYPRCWSRIWYTRNYNSILKLCKNRPMTSWFAPKMCWNSLKFLYVKKLARTRDFATET